MKYKPRKKRAFPKVLFSTMKTRWETPSKIYKSLNREFKFNHDPCPTEPKRDGLIGAWKERNYINPPYNKIDKWLRKGYHQAKQGRLCVFLLPSRTDTKWWHIFVMKATEIRFIRGRLKFGNSENSAPFPSCVVIFDGR